VLCNGITGELIWDCSVRLDGDWMEVDWLLVFFIIIYCSLNGIYRFRPSKEVVFCKVLSVKVKAFTTIL